MIKRFSSLCLSLSCVLFFSISVAKADIFVQGNKNIGVSVGASHSYDNDYTVLGVNASYFILDNLAIGVEYRGWFGGTPEISELSFPATYFVPLNSQIHPYGGVFYRQTFIEAPFEDYNSYGGRVGVAFKMNPKAFMSVGWVEEIYENSLGETSSNGYSEFALGFTF